MARLLRPCRNCFAKITAKVTIYTDLEYSTSADLTTKRDVQLIVSEAKADMVKWVAGMLIAQSAIIVALIKLL